MDFVVDGKAVRIRFLYEGEDKDGQIQSGGQALTNIKEKRIRTFCEIATKNQTEGSEFAGIAGDYTIRHPNDPFNKGVGRRTALARTLWQIKDKNIRAAIWQHYFKSHNDRRGIINTQTQEA
jgi:hypothetical protein